MYIRYSIIDVFSDQTELLEPEKKRNHIGSASKLYIKCMPEHALLFSISEIGVTAFM